MKIDKLFHLIQSLTRNEKSAITKATQSKDKTFDYVLLYRALQSIRGEYDEAAFLKKHAKKSFIKNFSARKTELYEKILASLRTQRQFGGRDKPIEFKVRELLEDAWLLKEKTLSEQSKARLQKARKEAKKYHLHEVLLEIFKLERTLLMREMPKNLECETEKLHAKISEVTEAIHNKYRMLALKDQIFVFIRQHNELNGKLDKAGLRKVMEEKELNNIAYCKSIEAESNYHACHAMFHYLMGNSSEAWIHARSQYLMWQEYKDLQRIKPIDYRNVLQNYLSFCNEVLRYEDFDLALAQMVGGKFRSNAEKASAIHNSLNVRLQKALNLCQWETAEGLQAEFKEKLKDFSEHIMPSRIMTFDLSFSRLSIVKGEWKKAIKRAQFVLDEGGTDIQKGLAFEAHLQIAISLYMQKDYSATEKKCRYLLDHFRKNEMGNDFEKGMLTILKRYAAVGDGHNKQIGCEFQDLLSKSHGGMDNKQMHKSVTHAWMRSQIVAVSLSTILHADLKEQERKLAKAKSQTSF